MHHLKKKHNLVSIAKAPVYSVYHLYIKAKKGLESSDATEEVMPMVEKTAPISLPITMVMS